LVPHGELARRGEADHPHIPVIDKSNRKTAKGLGLTIPELFLLHADEDHRIKRRDVRRGSKAPVRRKRVYVRLPQQS
jgi:hypothetical protein